MVNFFSLSSCSDGNSFVLYTKPEELILIDAGISFKKTKKLLESKSLSIENVKSIVITHFHKDHYFGLGTILKRIPTINLYFNDNYTSHFTDYPFKRHFTFENTFQVLDFNFFPFQIDHDMLNSGFIITYNDSKIGFLSDMGKFDDKLSSFLKDVKLLAIESNHSKEGLHNSKYSDDLKERILSEKGHLSNDDTAKVIEKVYNSNIKYILLHHLSKRTNSLQFVQNEVVSRFSFPETKFVISPYDSPSETITL
uniref:MBL fold metallo-hydrolase n=1 Tax=candidate division WOR-3 bacterium TaxID=2052148 RepID=A0A7C3J6W5_UNCW3